MLSHTAREARRKEIAALAEETREGDAKPDTHIVTSKKNFFGSFSQLLQRKIPERER